MVEIETYEDKSIMVGIEGKAYSIKRKADLPVRLVRELSRMFKRMSASMESGDVDDGFGQLIGGVKLISDIPEDVLDNLTIAQLNQLVEIFNGEAANP